MGKGRGGERVGLSLSGVCLRFPLPAFCLLQAAIRLLMEVVTEACDCVEACP